MKENVGSRSFTLLRSAHAFQSAGLHTSESQMKLERFRGQSHPRKHLPHHLTVGTSRRSQMRDLLTAPTETLPAPFHRRLPTFPQVEAMFPDQTQGHGADAGQAAALPQKGMPTRQLAHSISDSTCHFGDLDFIVSQMQSRESQV
ncbi:hypothetical protein HispidOSU_021909 [Sigmodon hispidus]